MDLKVTALENTTITGPVRSLVSGGKVGLYMANSAAAERTKAPFYDYETTLTGIAVPQGAAPSPDTIVVPTPLPGLPRWDVALTSGGEGSVAYTVFGGGWSELNVDKLTSGKLQSGYTYNVEEVANPSFVLNNSTSTAKEQFVSAIFSGAQLGVIGLQEQDGQQVPHVTDLIGSSSIPVSAGRVFADLSTDTPASYGFVYQVKKKGGADTPSGARCSGLSFATFDTKTGKASTAVELLKGLEFVEFDVAVSGNTFCIFGVTGDGSPLFAEFDSTGKANGDASMPVGSWSNAGRWVTNPTITTTPGAEGGFSFAFIEMEGDTPSALYSGTASQAPST